MENLIPLLGYRRSYVAQLEDTMSDKMFRKCPACGSGVTICGVSEFHNIGGFNGYSFAISCRCGTQRLNYQ